MRILAMTTLAIGTMLASAPTHAQTYDPDYPVCMHVFGRNGNFFDCSFTSIPQCQATASGRAAQCDINPYYANAQVPPVRYRHHRRAY